LQEKVDKSTNLQSKIFSVLIEKNALISFYTNYYVLIFSAVKKLTP